MALADNKRLYDIATRLQIYIEGVKVWQAREFELFLVEVSKELKQILGRIEFDNLDALSKTKLNSLLIELRKVQVKMYSRYLDKLAIQLRLFMQSDLIVNRRVWTSARYETEEDDTVYTDEEAQEELRTPLFPVLFGTASIAGTGLTLWSKITSNPIPANGQMMFPFLRNMLGSVQGAVINTVAKGYANGTKTQDVINELFVSSPQGTGSVMKRAAQQGAAALNTSLQHISEMVSASVASGLFGQYIWYSVIDSGTTDICRSRNLAIFTYGKGPLPPAHVGCRSHTAPVRDNGQPAPRETFAGWFKRQPESFREDSGSTGDIFKPNALTSDQLRNKIMQILSR